MTAETRSVNRDVYLFVLFLSVFLLKDLIKYITYGFSFNINYHLFAVVLLLGVFYFFKVIKSANVNYLTIIPCLYFVWVGCYFTLYYILDNGFNYSVLQYLIIIIYQSLLPVIVLSFCVLNAISFSKATNYTVLYVGALSICISYVVAFMLWLEPLKVYSHFQLLFERGVVVNPFQTSSSGVDLRISSVFNSAYLAAGFYNVILMFSLFLIRRRILKIVVVALILPLLLFTYNRNGMLIALISFFSFFVYCYVRKNFALILLVLYSFVLFLFILVPIILHSISLERYAAIDGSSLMKVSTLFSRFYAWVGFLKAENLLDIFLGMGIVQGIVDTGFYLDNGVYYILAQTGVLGLLLYGVFSMILFFKLYLINYHRPCIHSGLAMTLFVTGHALMFFNNSLYEPVFLFFYVVYPIAVALVLDKDVVRNERYQ